MGRWSERMCAGAMIAVAIVCLSGCTVIGVKLGGRSDPPIGSFASLTSLEIAALRGDEPVHIVPRTPESTRALSGRWGGRVLCPDGEIEAAYARWQGDHAGEAPAWGDSIRIDLGMRGRLAGHFLGFDQDFIRTRVGANTIPVDLRLVEAVDRAATGGTLSGDTLRAWVGRGEVPLASCYAITMRSLAPVGAPELIRLDCVARVERPASRSGRNAGLLFGLICDAIAAGILLSRAGAF